LAIMSPPFLLSFFPISDRRQPQMQRFVMFGGSRYT
jgi:hypothetical protein